jgi:hypothetical protein
LVDIVAKYPLHFTSSGSGGSYWVTSLSSTDIGRQYDAKGVEICRYHSLDRCRNGDDCTYSHSDPVPLPVKQSIDDADGEGEDEEVDEGMDDKDGRPDLVSVVDALKQLLSCAADHSLMGSTLEGGYQLNTGIPLFVVSHCLFFFYLIELLNR